MKLATYLDVDGYMRTVPNVVRQRRDDEPFPGELIAYVPTTAAVEVRLGLVVARTGTTTVVAWNDWYDKLDPGLRSKEQRTWVLERLFGT